MRCCIRHPIFGKRFAASADPIDSLLVLLNLLEAYAESFGKRRLRNVERVPAHADAAADMAINWIDWHINLTQQRVRE